LGLNNSGETVHLTAGPTSAVVLDAVSFGAGTDESWTRSPDITGATFVAHTAATDHATDRSWTPGTLVTGQPFAAVSP
jgi:hypothetical protein